MYFAIAQLYGQSRPGERPMQSAPRRPALLDRAKGWGHFPSTPLRALQQRPARKFATKNKKHWRKPMPKLLSDEEVTAYRDRGYHFPIDALSAGEVADFRRKLEDYEAESGSAFTAAVGPRTPRPLFSV